MSKTYSIIAVATLAAIAVGIAAEDQAKPVAQSDAATRTDSVLSAGIISPQENDRRLARWLAVDNDSILACAQQAQDRTENARVKELAKMIAEDHKRFQEQLNAFTRTAVDDGNITSQAKTATLLKDDGRSRDNRLAFAPTDFLAVKESVCANLRTKAEKEFKAFQGADFDRAFVAHMIFGHEALITSVDTVKGDATQQLQTTLAEFRELTAQHLKRIRELQADHLRTATRG